MTFSFFVSLSSSASLNISKMVVYDEYRQEVLIMLCENFLSDLFTIIEFCFSFYYKDI